MVPGVDAIGTIREVRQVMGSLVLPLTVTAGFVGGLFVIHRLEQSARAVSRVLVPAALIPLALIIVATLPEQRLTLGQPADHETPI
jgi:hypothetical protein